jgi:ABC-type multidrug transport system ATPase subunit
MDPQNRSEVWRVIERTKQQRIVVLTTHSMEEANVLSDVIGIMSAGRLKCFGSASALKRQYGEGFYLHLISQTTNRHIVKRAIRSLVPGTLISPVYFCVTFIRIIHNNNLCYSC